MRYGSRGLTFELVEQWGRLPKGWDLVELGGVAVDAQDRVYAFTRGPHPVIVFDRDGRFLTSWGEGVFKNAHGIQIGPAGSVWCADDHDHTVRRFTPDGKLLLTLGVPGQPSDTGYEWGKNTSVKRGGRPFNRPTNVGFSLEGDVYITDGYGNARVHRFAPNGELLYSWGQPGSGPGEFVGPHGVWAGPSGIVYVGDRYNNRIQVFSPKGEFISMWTEVYTPSDILIDRENHVFVAEMGFIPKNWIWGPKPSQEDSYPRVTIRNLKGEVLERLYGPDPHAPGAFMAPHGLAMDSRGDLYVAEVCKTRAAAIPGVDPTGLHPLQKFARVRS